MSQFGAAGVMGPAWIKPTPEPTLLGQVRAGETWLFRAQGTWRDWFIPCGPNGYRNFLAEVLDVYPVAADQPFFMLMGRLKGRPDQLFPIGAECQKTFDRTGDVEVFANDASRMYGNNCGRISLFATRADHLSAPETDCECPSLRTRWNGVRQAFSRTHGILLVAALAILPCVALAASQQGQDLVRTIGESSSLGGPQFAFAACLLFLALQAWFWPRMIIRSNYGSNRKNWHPSWLLKWAPRALGAAPFLFVIVAILQNPAPNTGFILSVVALGLAFFAFVILRQDVQQRVERLTRREGEPFRIGRWWVIASLALAVITMTWAIVDPVGMGRVIGAPGAVFLGLGLLVPPLVVAIQLGAAARFPTLLGLLITVATFSLWLDNHPVGWRAPSTYAGQADQRMTLEYAYDMWRKQARPSRDGKIPLVLVASEGGASRAGYWTAEVLGELHEKSSGTFANNLFAISSVSGGSVGAVAYVATLQDRPQLSPRQVHAAASKAAGDDFLSPTLVGLLFPDLLQRFVPLAVLPDRAQALEKAFEAGWRRHCRPSGTCTSPNLWGAKFTKLGPADGTSWRPLVIVNGASEETGRPVLTSRIAFAPEEVDADDFYTITGRDIPISTAIHNGARFPWISPAGTLTGASGARGHIVDGGYFDAAGTEVIRQLERAISEGPGKKDQHKLKFVVVFIGYRGATEDARPLGGVNAASPGAPAAAGQTKTRHLLNEVRAPLVAMAQSRSAHGAHLMRENKLSNASNLGDIDPFLRSEREDRIYEPILLCDQYVGGRRLFAAPMDWALSDCAKAYMRRAAGAPWDATAGKVCATVMKRGVPCAKKNRDAIARVASLIQ